MTGFSTVRSSDGVLIARAGRIDELERLGLGAPDGWLRRLEGRSAGDGRGATALLELADGSRLRLKQLRRGGVLRGLRRDRFVGERRPRANLEIPSIARERGIATPAAVALLIVGGPPGLVRAWVAHDEVEGALDLRAQMRDVWCEAAGRSAVALVRVMHECGLEHRDLNVGNLLCRRESDDSWASWVVDLDGARLHAGPLSFSLRQRSLRRLERSCVKQGSSGWAGAPLADRLYQWYAADDSALGARLDRGRALGRWLVRIHRLGW